MVFQKYHRKLAVMTVAMLFSFAGCLGGVPEETPVLMEQEDITIENLVEIEDGIVYETWGKRLTEEDVTIKIFARQDSGSVVVEEAPFWQEMAKMTGVTIVGTADGDLDEVSDLYIHAYDGLNSDIVSVSHLAEEMSYIASDGKFLDLNDYLDYMPNLRRFIETEMGRQVYEMLLAPDGAFYLIPSVESFSQTHVPVIRKDWLDELGMPLPQTTDDLYRTLKAFKDNDMGNGITVPFVAADWVLKQNAPVLWGARTETRATGRMVNKPDGSFYHGWSTEEFRYMLTEMSRWYDEGLIASNVFTVEDALNDHFPSDQGGFTYWRRALDYKGQSNMPEGFDLEVILPTEFKGQRLDQRATHPIRKGRVGISASSKHPEIAAMFLDALLSPEGSVGQETGFVGKDVFLFETDDQGYDVYRVSQKMEAMLYEDRTYGSVKEAQHGYGSLGIGFSTHAYRDSLKIISSNTESAGAAGGRDEVNRMFAEAYEDGTLTFIPARTMIFSSEITGEINDIKSVLEGYQNMVFEQAVTGSYKELDDQWWESYIQECNRLGMERLVEIYNQH